MTENKTVKEFWEPGSQRDKLVDFYRAIKDREAYQGQHPWPLTKPLNDKARFLKVRKLAKDLMDDYNTEPGQLKAMLESAEWTPENIETVLDQEESSDPGTSV
jgi:hypothetical protein